MRIATAWPHGAFEAPLLRSLDERGRRDLQAASRALLGEAGEIVYREGTSGDSFFVVVSGKVEVSTRAAKRARIVRSGQTFGEEAALPETARAATARIDEPALLVELPVHLFERAAQRSGGNKARELQRRVLERAGTLALLRALPCSSLLGERELSILLDAAQVREYARGTRIVEEGEFAEAALWLVTGLAEFDEAGAGRLLRPGDWYGIDRALSGARHSTSCVAAGKSRIVKLPSLALAELERANPEFVTALVDGERARVAVQALALRRHADSPPEQVFKDVRRLQVATSLLVINPAACVRCGHCALTCSDLHGAPRFERRGAFVSAELASPSPSTLLLPSACHHCTAPECLDECPTAAITRAADGTVLIREESCTGCGACAKACPWDSIRMAPRTSSSRALSDEVAVKCDLCRDHDGPACVRACPTDAIARVEPTRDFADVRQLLSLPEPVSPPAVRERAGVRWIAGGALVALLVSALSHRAHTSETLEAGRGLALGCGVMAAVACAGALAYVVPKRVRRARVRPMMLLHTGVGLVAAGGAAVHGGLRFAPTWAGALEACFWLTVVLGIAGSFLYRMTPPALARIEDRGTLPEDLPLERRVLFETLEQKLSGTDELVKRIASRILLPYARKSFGPLMLVASGRTLVSEQARLRALIESLLDGRGQDRLGGLADVTAVAVRIRALPARRALAALLAGWLPLHIALSGILVALLVIHLIAVWRMS